MPNLPRFPIIFPDGRVALGVRGRPGSELGPALRGMGLTTGVPTLVVVGAGARHSHVDRLGPLLEKVVVAVAEAADATVVDDGLAGGVSGLLGRVRRGKKAGFPLLGVASDGSRGDGAGDGGRGDGAGDGLDPGHTHFVLVPARSPRELFRWEAAVATALAGGNRSVVLLAAGGEPAWDAVAEHVHAGRLVVAVSRTGGVADQLSAAVARRPADARAAPLVASGRVAAVDPARGAAHVADMLRTFLSRPNALGPGRS